MRIVCLLLLVAKVNMSMVQAGLPNLKGILLEISVQDHLDLKKLDTMLYCSLSSWSQASNLAEGGGVAQL